jgi:hypothetical protein
MTTRDQFHSLNLSRRGLLRGATLFAAGGALLGTTMTAGSAVAANKLAQRTVNYQDKPRGKAQCDNCAQWQSPSACKLVDGSISPAGWCSVYAPKS